MSRLSPVFAIAVSAVLLYPLWPALPALAQIYTWTDAQGRRQVSDRPPEGLVKDLKVQGARWGVTTPLSTPAAGSPPAAKKPQTLDEKALDFNKRQIEREENRIKQEKADAEARERAVRCEQARGYLRSLEAGGRASRLDPKTGERLYLDDKDLEKELVEARRSADSWCKPAPTPPAGSTQVSPPK